MRGSGEVGRSLIVGTFNFTPIIVKAIKRHELRLCLVRGRPSVI